MLVVGETGKPPVLVRSGEVREGVCVGLQERGRERPASGPEQESFLVETAHDLSLKDSLDFARLRRGEGKRIFQTKGTARVEIHEFGQHDGSGNLRTLCLAEAKSKCTQQELQ